MKLLFFPFLGLDEYATILIVCMLWLKIEGDDQISAIRLREKNEDEGNEVKTGCVKVVFVILFNSRGKHLDEGSEN